MKLLVAILAVIGAAVPATPNRNLQQLPTLSASAPAPAPGPNSCPAPTNPASTCIAQAAQFQTTCAAFSSALLAATGGALAARSEGEMRVLLQQMQLSNQLPSADCCTTVVGLLKNACICDPSVQAAAKAQLNMKPADFQTVGRLFLAACQKPACYDTCRLSA